MQFENHLPFSVVVCTYDVGDFLFWLPWQVHKLEPRELRTITAHDHGRCRVKIEILDGPLIWVLDAPDDVVYADADLVRIGPCTAVGGSADPDRARAEFLRRNAARVVLAEDWIPGPRPPSGDPMVCAVIMSMPEHA